MEALELLKGRRSVRQFTNEVVSRDLLKEIVDVARFAPSWGNTQVPRYTIVDNPAKIAEIANGGVNDFIYNKETLQNAKGVCVLSYVNGISGKGMTGKYETNKEGSWAIFDAGIACQTFCLAAYEKGIATCILGIMDDVSVAKIIGLPANETVAALVVYGYKDGAVARMPRHGVDKLLRFAD